MVGHGDRPGTGQCEIAGIADGIAQLTGPVAGAARRPENAPVGCERDEPRCLAVEHVHIRVGIGIE